MGRFALANADQPSETMPHSKPLRVRIVDLPREPLLKSTPILVLDAVEGTGR
jgi:hypothetical protein